MSPKTKEAQEKVRDLSRSKIIQAALVLFSEKGFHASSMDQLAKKAGVSKGLIYNYFENKEDLLRKIIDEALSMNQEFDFSFDSENPKEAFKNFIDQFIHLLKTKTDYLRLILGLSVQVRTFDFIQDIAQAKTKMYDHFFEEMLHSLGFKGTEGEIIELEVILEGAATIYYVIGDDNKLDVLRDHLIEKYCNQL